MYLQGAITVDPSQLTQLERVKPTKGFARMAHLLTGGLATPQEERETFCAVTILQQLNVVMRSLGVDNVVRLSKDDVVFFEDTEGIEGDLKKAFDEFAEKATAEEASLFNTLRLLLEHHTDEQTYLIDIRINRTHRVGEHPIQITVNGLPADLACESGAEFDRDSLNEVFESQQSYDRFVTRHKHLFTEFLDGIEQAFKERMKVDKVSVSSRVKIIRPEQRINRRDEVPHDADHYYDPVYEDHHGFGDAFFYAWLWSDLCHTNDIHCQDCVLVDSAGADVLSVGAEGIQAGEDNTMNVEEPFSAPEASVHNVASEDHLSSETDDSPGFFGMLAGGSDDADSRNWLSSLGDSIGDAFSGGDDGGSSCGGSSCGGGCGGCGGD